jgi:DNA-binding NarL/FixJ family response regulator
MLRDIIEDAIGHQADMELIADGASDCSKAVKRSAADVVIMADQRVLGSAAPEQLLVINPHLKVFVVTDDGRQAHLLEFRETPVVPVSPQRLVDAIRAAVGTGDGPPSACLARPTSLGGPRET